MISCKLRICDDLPDFIRSKAIGLTLLVTTKYRWDTRLDVRDIVWRRKPLTLVDRQGRTLVVTNYGLDLFRGEANLLALAVAVAVGEKSSTRDLGGSRGCLA